MDEESVFLEAVAIHSDDERAAYLDRVCGGDDRLRASVESLLRHHDIAGRFLEIPPVELQQTFAAASGDTLNQSRRDRTLDILTPSAKPGCIGELGPYEILEVVGRGGMGFVLRARDTKLHRDVAIKLMNESVASSSLGVRRFLREARAAAAVRHDHVVTIYAIHDEGPVPYLVMEFIDGVSLERMTEAGQPLEAQEVARIGMQIAGGLEAAHQRGLVHRDIKPANILLEADTQRVKITDFGLAHALDDGQLTRAGELAGTPQFMSPEQARGMRADHRSDLFSLGSVLYKLCTGRPAFPAESAVAVLRGICDDHPTPVRAVNDQIPEWLETIVHRLLEKDPNLRPQSAGEVVQLLGAGQVSHPLPVPARNRRNRRTLGVLFGGIVLACAGVVLIVNRDGKSTRVEVPDGAQVRVTKEGTVEVDLPGDRAATPPSVAAVPSPVREVAARLVELNPGFNGLVDCTMEGDEVVELRLIVDQVRDVSPLKSLRNLRRVTCAGSAPRSGQLADLSPLAGLRLKALDCSNTQVSDLTPLTEMPLEQLFCSHTNITDLTPLAGKRLAQLQVQGTQVSNLSPLRGMPLVDLNISATRVTDLSPLQGMQLIGLYCDATRVADLAPLAGMPLKQLNWRGYDQSDPRHQQVVKSLSALEVIDSVPAGEFWQGIEAKQRNE